MKLRFLMFFAAMCATASAHGQGLLESERWVGWLEPATKVYYDGEDRRIVLVDEKLDYVQFRFNDFGGGLKPNRLLRVPKASWGKAQIIGFESGSIYVDSASATGGKMYRFSLDSSFKKDVLAPVFADSIQINGRELLDIDRRAVGSFVNVRSWSNDQLRTLSQLVISDTLRPEWLSYQAGRWIGVWGFDGKAPTLSFLASGGVWNEFPYPINQPGVVPKRMFIIDNDSLLVIGTKGDSAVFNFLRLRQAASGSTGNRVKLGEFTMFYETSQSVAPSVAKPELNPNEKSSSVVPNEQSVGTERTKKKGRFAVMFDTFKNADDAYALLNGLIGKFPDAYAVDTKEGIAVMGPNRISLAGIQADSSSAASSGIGVKKLVRYADKLKERKETLVTLQVYDDGAKTPVPFTLVFFNRGTDRIIFTDTVRSGKVNFIYSHGAELGVAISSPGFFPQSLRLNPAMAPVATHYFHDMFMKPLVAKDPLNPNRMVVQTASLDFQNVLFDFNQDVPRRISFVEINAMKEALSGLDSVVLVVEGHTDDIGSDAYNLALGQRRSAYVASEIQKVLRSTASLSSVSKGESVPVADNDNEFHRSLNRRVTLKVTGGGKVATPRKPEAAKPVAIEEVMKETEAEEPIEEFPAEMNPVEEDVEESLNEPNEIEITEVREAQPVLATSSEPTAKKAIKTPNKNVKPKKDSQTPKSNSKVDKKVKSEQDKIAKFEAEKAKEAAAEAKKAKELKEAEDLKKAKEAAERRKEADKAKKKAEKEQKKGKK